MHSECKACGMPMTRQSDHACDDPARDYCVHCARPDGAMQSYDEKLESLTAFMAASRNMDEASARNAAKEHLAALPAWAERHK